MIKIEQNIIEQNQNGSKIKELNELAPILDSLRRKGKKIVLCHGVFDLLHIGHIRHFEQARQFGDILVVTLTPDQFVNKGSHRPAFTEKLRAEAIAALHCVDYVAVNQWSIAPETIKLLKPNFYAKGKEYSQVENDVTGKITDEENAIKAVGGKLIFTDDIIFSSSSLINRYLPTFSEEVCAYLEVFKERHHFDEIAQHLDSVKGLKVLVVGESIIDEYQYCEVLGKSAKEPILVAKCTQSEKFLGGILAVANHIANFSDKVDVLTYLGRESSHEDFIRANLPERVGKNFLYKRNSPTILKRRFVEDHSFQKLFETYIINDEVLTEEENQDFCRRLKTLLPQYDLAVVVDYGHGILGVPAIDVLCKEGRFLAVNTQSNAGNRGFNTISKYPRADYVCLAMHEIMLETKQRWMSPREMILDAAKRVNCPRILLTKGKMGSLSYWNQEGFCEVPAFDQRVVDRMGAGDAVISITALLAAQGAPAEIIGLVGNVCGSQAVATVGHRTFIEKPRLLKHIQSLLK